MNSKNFLPSLFTACSALCLLAQSSFVATFGQLKYKDVGDSIKITGNTGGLKGHVEIPKKIDGKPVKAIGTHAFQYQGNLTRITIPDSVTSIGDSAFSWCERLTSITIPDSVTSIGDYAFAYCGGLTSINIPAKLVFIPGGTFAGCINLSSFTVDASNLNYSTIDEVLYDYKQSTLILYPEGKGDSYTIPSGVVTIGNYAFADNTSLKNILMSDSVTSIGDYAFAGCWRLTSIAIPDSVTSIGDFVFSNCVRLTSITIPDSVTSIGDYAFFNCAELASVTIPGSVTSIGDYSFTYCGGLTSITIPDSVTDIGNYAFAYCDGLTSALFIGDAPSSMGILVFEGSGPVIGRIRIGFYDYERNFTAYYLNGKLGFKNFEYNAIMRNVGPMMDILLNEKRTLKNGKGISRFKNTTNNTRGQRLHFTIVNTGTSTLTNLAITKTGKQRNNFIISKLDKTPLESGAATTFTVTFKPTVAGRMSVGLRIKSNAIEGNPFRIRLQGEVNGVMNGVTD